MMKGFLSCMLSSHTLHVSSLAFASFTCLKSFSREDWKESSQLHPKTHSSESFDSQRRLGSPSNFPPLMHVCVVCSRLEMPAACSACLKVKRLNIFLPRSPTWLSYNSSSDPANTVWATHPSNLFSKTYVSTNTRTTKQDRAGACWYTDLKADKALRSTENIGKQRVTDGPQPSALTKHKQQRADKSD